MDSNALSGVTVETAELLARTQGGLEFKDAETYRFRVAWASSKPVQGTGAWIPLRGTAASGVYRFDITVANAQAWESQTLRELRVDAAPIPVAIPASPFNFRSVPVGAWVAGAFLVLILLRMLTARK